MRFISAALIGHFKGRLDRRRAQDGLRATKSRKIQVVNRFRSRRFCRGRPQNPARGGRRRRRRRRSHFQGSLAVGRRCPAIDRRRAVRVKERQTRDREKGGELVRRRVGLLPRSRRGRSAEEAESQRRRRLLPGSRGRVPRPENELGRRSGGQGLSHRRQSQFGRDERGYERRRRADDGQIRMFVFRPALDGGPGADCSG